MFARIAGFEFRYQAASNLFRVSALLLLVGSFLNMAGFRLVQTEGGNVAANSPHELMLLHGVASLLFLFLGAAFIADAVNRDEQSGFAPILRSTGVGKRDYVLGRFAGAMAVGATLVACVTVGSLLGALAPLAVPASIGPHRWSAYALAFGAMALPNLLVIGAVLFALATLTRSTAGTFFGVIGILIAYLMAQKLLAGEASLSAWAMADPLGVSAYTAASRYLTAAELNAGATPVSATMLAGRALWSLLALGLVAMTVRRFDLAERGPSKRRLKRLAREEARRESDASARVAPALPAPRAGRRPDRAAFAARVALETRFVGKSPAFWMLLLVALAITLAGLFNNDGFLGASYVLTDATTLPIVASGFSTLLIAIAAFFGGELVWRERDRRFDEIVDSTPMPHAALLLPKLAGLALILVAMLVAGLLVGGAVQVATGGQVPSPEAALRWYLLPSAVDMLLVAALAVVVHALSPNKYVGWGLMLAYLLVRVFASGIGLHHPLMLYGMVPDGPLSDMNGNAPFEEAAWWFRLLWGLVAAALLWLVQLSWTRGPDRGLAQRFGRLRSALRGGGARVTGLALGALIATVGGWIAYNTVILNPLKTEDETNRYLADYERRFLKFAALPQPTIRHQALAVRVDPAAVRADVSGRFDLVNETGVPIRDLHVRLADPALDWRSVDVPGAVLVRDDAAFHYRIYRLAQPMLPGEARRLNFTTRREQRGFRAGGAETGIANGGELNAFDLTPRIGMHDAGLLTDPATRAAMGLPAARPIARFDDAAAAARLVPDQRPATSDIRVTTPAAERGIAPGRLVSDRVTNGWRTTRYVADRPTRNDFAVMTGRYAVRRAIRDGVDYQIYYHPAHGPNVERMLKTMQESVAAYRAAFGPYPHDHLRLVETAYRTGGHAYAGTIALGEAGGFTMDLSDPAKLDVASMVLAHEVSHQWWGQQLVPNRMQGATLLVETLAQYSAMKVAKQRDGRAKMGPYFAFQRDRYLAGRRAEPGGELPLIAVDFGHDHVAYGKGALALFQVQDRLGEAAVDRALKGLLQRFPASRLPAPRSVDLVAALRAEARDPLDRALITDLFEAITLYDLAVEAPTATRRADGRWDVVVPVRAQKLVADRDGRERPAPLRAPIMVGLFAADPGSGLPDRARPIALATRTIRGGLQTVRFVTAVRPAFAAVDPDDLYLDRTPKTKIASIP